MNVAFLVFDLLLKYVILLTLTTYFLLCFFFVKKTPRSKLIRPMFHLSNDLILSRFRENIILILSCLNTQLESFST